MDSEQRAGIITRVEAVWGKMQPGLVEVWGDHLTDRDADTGWRALRALELTETRRPSMATFVETYVVEWKKRPTAPPEQTLERPDCMMCGGTGWEQVIGPFITVGGNEAPAGTEGVRRCSNGCPVNDEPSAPQPLTDADRERGLAAIAHLREMGFDSIGREPADDEEVF